MVTKKEPFIVDPDKEFQKEINKSIKLLGDLTIPYKLMTQSWFKGNHGIFPEKRGGPGQYADLSPAYKKTKKRYLGSPYPILRGFFKPKGQPARKSGKLARSMTDPDSPDSVNVIINKKILILGTKAKNKKGFPYPIALQKGTGNMPARPFVLIGGERTAPFKINQRRKNWIKMLRDYTLQVSQFAEKK